MANRPEKTVELPGGQKVVMRTYLTAREVLGVAKETDGKEGVTNFDKADKLIGLAVVSVDDVRENLTDYVQDLPVQDYTFLMNEVTKLVQGFTKAE